MNTYKANKIRCTLYDMLLAFLVMLFIMSAMMSPTLGNSHFYSRYIDGKSDITVELQSSLKEKTDDIAQKTGIDPLAFEFAVGQKKISATQKEIINAVFSGSNYDYSDSAGIEDAYHDGIVEYYRFNGLELDEEALERAVPMACKAFNSVFGISNNKEMKTFVTFLSKYSIALVAVSLVFIVLAVLKIFTLHGGRTKMFGHYGSALISAGYGAILIAILNLIFKFAEKLYLTNNVGFNTAFAGACKTYNLIFALFGIAFIIAGFSMINHVRSYYNSKSSKQKQEIDINRSLYVKREDGEDKTIEELVNDRRKELENNGD